MLQLILKERGNVSGKVAILFHNLGPYHVARIRGLSAQLKDIVLIELASQAEEREWKRSEIPGVERITLVDGKYEEIPSRRLVRLVNETLNRTRPTCVAVTGYGDPAMRAAAQWARKCGRKAVLFSESQKCDWPRNPIKEYIKGVWVRNHYDAAFVGGSSAAAYLESLGFDPDRIWRGYNVVDNEYFAIRTEAVRPHSERLRRELKLPERFFLYVGRFSIEKNLIKLFRAFRQYRAIAGEAAWDLVMVGNGPQDAELKAVAEDLRLKGVHWTGFKQINELPQYYALASAFVLSSLKEPWGLVVNEAMASGLPVLVSQRCGCAHDLVQPGINGWVVDPFDEMNMAEGLTRMSLEATDRKAMGDASRSIVAKYTPQTWAAALSDCISFAMSQHRY